MLKRTIDMKILRGLSINKIFSTKLSGSPISYKKADNIKVLDWLNFELIDQDVNNTLIQRKKMSKLK